MEKKIRLFYFKTDNNGMMLERELMDIPELPDFDTIYLTPNVYKRLPGNYQKELAMKGALPCMVVPNVGFIKGVTNIREWINKTYRAQRNGQVNMKQQVHQQYQGQIQSHPYFHSQSQPQHDQRSQQPELPTELQSIDTTKLRGGPVRSIDRPDIPIPKTNGFGIDMNQFHNNRQQLMNVERTTDIQSFNANEMGQLSDKYSGFDDNQNALFGSNQNFEFIGAPPVIKATENPNHTQQTTHMELPPHMRPVKVGGRSNDDIVRQMQRHSIR